MKKLFVVVDGTTYSQDDRLEIDANTAYIEDWDAMEANGFTAKCYRADVTTWKITVAGNVVYHGIDKPHRTETADSVTLTFPPALTPDDTQEVDVVLFRA